MDRHKIRKLRRRLERFYAQHKPTAKTFPFLFLSVFLIGFSPLDSTEPTPGLSATLRKRAVVMPPPQLSIRNPEKEEAWNFFYPVWKENTLWSVFRFEEKPADPLDHFTDLHGFVSDPDNRLDSEFKVPASLRSRVHFWMEVFARFSSRIRIVHDRNSPQIIYGYIDLRPIYRVAPNEAVAILRSQSIERKVMRSLKARMAEAAGLSSTALLSVDERTQLKNILSRLGALNPSGFARATDSLRTQTGQSDMFLMAIQRSRQLLPHIESVFRQNGLPGGLARIPFVESSFNTQATSKIGAVGIWQFVPETARQMIHSDSEKWADPLRQTKAAVRLLRMYRGLVPDWGAAITAYNSGIGRIRRIMQKYKIPSAEGLVDVPSSENLGFAGKNFYAEFLAVNLIEAYKEEIFTHLLSPVQYSLVFKDDRPLPKDFCDF